MATFDFSRALASQGKAFAPHQAFMDPTIPVATYSPGRTREKAVISQRNALHHSQAYGGAEAIDWVYDCINLYADPAATADYTLTDMAGTRLVREMTPGTPKDYKVGPKQLYDLLDRPNPYMLYDELMSLLVIDLLLVGNAYWFKWQTNDENQPLALYRMAPGHVKIVPGQFGPESYEYQPPGSANKLVIKDPSKVVHFRRANPHSNYYGMGVIQGGGRAMDLEIAITDTQASYFENKAEPSLIIESERRIPRDIWRKLYAQVRARAAGSGNNGALLMLENGLKASSMTAGTQAAMFDTLSKMSRDRVYAKFRANPRLLGLSDESTASDKISDIRREFDVATLKPFLKRVSMAVSASLAESYDCKFEIDHRSVLAAADQLNVAVAVSNLPMVKVREVRRQFADFGIEESTGDPEVDELLLNKPTPEMGPNGESIDPITGKVITSGAAGSPPADPVPSPGGGRPPKRSNTVSVRPSGKAIEDDITSRIEDALRALEAKAVSTPAPDNSLPSEVRPSDSFANARKADIDGVAALLQRDLQAAASDLERSLLDTVEGKALKTSDLVSRVRNNDAWKDFRTRVKEAFADALQRAASSGVMHSGLTPDEDVDYEAIADTVMGRKGGLNDIVKTFKDRIVKRVREARDTDAERHDYNNVIQQAISEWSNGSAATIAATEATHAYNEATLTAAELAGVTHVYVEDGDDSDEPCQTANGQVWTVDAARENRLEHPNCRRAFLPVTAVS